MMAPMVDQAGRAACAPAGHRVGATGVFFTAIGVIFAMEE